MQKQLNSKRNIDEYLDHLELLSSKIADNISMGLFHEINKMDIERKNIINKISSDAANLNDINRNRLKLVWVNNNEIEGSAKFYALCLHLKQLLMIFL